MVGIVSSLVLRLVYELVALADCLHGPIHWSSHVIAILPLHTFCPWKSLDCYAYRKKRYRYYSKHR